MFDRFEEEAKNALNEARRAAEGMGASAITDLHILMGCCRTPGTLAVRILEECGHDAVEIADQAETMARASAGGASPDGQLPFTPLARGVLEQMLRAADDLKHKEIGSHHLMLGLLASRGPAEEILDGAGLDEVLAREAAVRVHRQFISERAPVPTSAVPLTQKQERVQILLRAKEVCIELQQYEVASSLRNLAHWLDTQR